MPDYPRVIARVVGAGAGVEYVLQQGHLIITRKRTDGR